MALTNVQALDVVIGCVRGVSGRAVPPNQSLKDGGVVDPPRLGAFRALVVSDAQLGVRKHDHRIDSSALSSVGVDDTVQATANVVQANATAILADALRSAPSVAGAPAGPPAAAATKLPGATQKKTRKTTRSSSRAKATGTKGSGKQTAKRSGKKASKRSGKTSRKTARKAGRKAGKRSAAKRDRRGRAK